MEMEILNMHHSQLSTCILMNLSARFRVYQLVFLENGNQSKVKHACFVLAFPSPPSPISAQISRVFNLNHLFAAAWKTDSKQISALVYDKALK
jgi:hypothetical protein